MPRTPSDRDDRQMDLFDRPVAPPASPSPTPAPAPDPAALGDAELLARFATASVAEVVSLGMEVVRRQPAGWPQAVLALWERFLGFGTVQPLREQIVVLDIIRRTGEAGLLRQILQRGPVADGLHAELLLVAAECRVALPTPVVLRGLSDARPPVRQAAAHVAGLSGLPADGLHPHLTDPSRAVRRAVATALAEAGDAIARETLLFEMRLMPDRAGLEALTHLADEDVVIRLGQIARQHPGWCGFVIELLEGIDHPKAPRVAAGLMSEARDR
jgi:hypothetical protein